MQIWRINCMWHDLSTRRVALRTLRRTATHCNTLQHTATHYAESYTTYDADMTHQLHETWRVNSKSCYTRTGTHCNTLQHTVQLTATHCNTLQHTATHLMTRQLKGLWYDRSWAARNTKPCTVYLQTYTLSPYPIHTAGNNMKPYTLYIKSYTITPYPIHTAEAEPQVTLNRIPFTLKPTAWAHTLSIRQGLCRK